MWAEGETEAHPLVTVVIPTFNRTRFLGEAIDSALAQTYPNLEIVVSDDASSEDVYGSVVSRYEGRGVIYRRNPQNVGMGANIWAALRAARGQYVATIHDDDAWEPDFLSVLVPALEAHRDVSVAFSDHHVMDSSGAIHDDLSDQGTRSSGRDRLQPGVVHDYLERIVHTRVVPAAMAAVFRKSAIDWADFAPEIGTFYDLWLTYLSARTGAPAYYDPRRLTRYRVHEQSETLSWGAGAGKMRALRQSEFVLGRYLDDPAMARFRSTIEMEYARAAVALVLALIDQRLDQDVDDVLGRASGRVRHPALRASMLVLGHLPVVARKPLRDLIVRTRMLLASL